MKTISLLLLSTVISEAKIDRVLVLENRAQVTRVQTVQCEAKRLDAVFEHLPNSLDPRTLRPDVRTRGAEAIGISSEVVKHEDGADVRTADLRKQIEALEERLRVLAHTQQNLQEEEQTLGAFSEISAAALREKLRNPRPTRDAWAQELDSFEKRYLEIYGRGVENAQSQRKVNSELSVLRRQLARLGSTTERTSRKAMVAVDCGQNRTVEVSVTYVVPGARWRPEYDVDFTPTRGDKVGQGKARFTVSAVVQQSTGEDWSDVQLVLSTAKPKLGAEAPFPMPLNVSGYEVKEGKVLVEASEKRDSLQTGGAAGQGQAAAASVDDKGQSFTLTIPRRVSIVADGRPYWVPVDVIEAKAEAKLVTVPKLSPYVYHLVKLDNPAPYPLLAGRLHSFRKGRFVGDSNMEYRGPGEPMEISLGIDEEVKVTRAPVQKQNNKGGFLSSNKHIVHEYEIELSNRTDGGATVELRENLPVTKIEDVKVEINGEKTTSGFVHDENRGFLTWSVAMKKGEKKKIGLAYRITLPDDWKVQIR